MGRFLTLHLLNQRRCRKVRGAHQLTDGMEHLIGAGPQLIGQAYNWPARNQPVVYLGKGSVD